MNEPKKLTTESGAPVADNQNSLTAGPRGPLLVQDWQLFEKHAHFNRERIPERVVHAKGSGAYGTLKITGDISRYTKAKALQPGAQSECFVRFSYVAGERGAADAERDLRGFAIKVIPRKATGTWSAITRRFSRCATPTSFPTSSANRSATPRPTSTIPPRCGIGFRYCQRLCIR